MKYLMICLTVCVLSGAVTADVHHVPADFPTIQYAVDAAVDGDEIIVAPGTYSSTAGEVVDMRGKEIWLHSSGGAEVTIIDGEGTRRGILCNNNETSNTVIEGFTITNGYSSNGGGMYNDSSPTLTNCAFSNNTATNDGGGMFSSGNATLTDCTFTGNTATNRGGGMRCGTTAITGCDFIQNIAKNGGGIFSVGTNEGNSPTISNSNFCENTPDAIDGNWNNKGENEFLTTCGDVQGACCVEDSCYEVELIFCESIKGEWLGYNATCEEDSCTDPPQYGACCVNGESIPLFDYDCDRILGTFMGEGTNPDDITCPVHCAEDVTGDGVVDVSDLLAIIAIWGACP